MIISENVEQGSEQWFNLRKGRATASQFKKILTPTGKKSASAKGYMRVLARECICADPMEFFGNKYTEWGNEHEPDARDLFETETGLKVHEVGFVNRADDAPVGCSPDGLIMDDAGNYVGGLEIKCPQVDTHVGYLLDGELPSDYKMQVHGSMAVTGLPYWYFMSYFPGLNPLIIKVERDAFTDTVSTALDDFVIEYAAERERVLAAILPGKSHAPSEEEESIL